VQQQAARDRIAQTKTLGYKLVDDSQKIRNGVPCLEVIVAKGFVVVRNLTCQGDNSFERWVNVSIVTKQDPEHSAVVDELIGSVRYLEVQ